MNFSLTAALLALPAALTTLWDSTVVLYSRVHPVQVVEAATIAQEATGRHDIEVINTQALDVTGVSSNGSQTELDVTRYAGRTYLAYRSQAAGEAPTLRVISRSADGKWRSETELHTGGDLRTPRFLAWKGRLFAYGTSLSGAGTDRRVSGLLATSVVGNGLWRDWVRLKGAEVAASKIRLQRDLPVMIGYRARKKEYVFEEPHVDLHLLTTRDGYNWVPLNSEGLGATTSNPGLASLGAGEDGDFYALLSGRDGLGGGSATALCTSAQWGWRNWDCREDERRLDGAEVFSHDGEVYVVGRRDASVAPDVSQPAAAGIVGVLQERASRLLALQRCAIWRWDKRRGRLAFMTDLPSRGDTCAPAVLKGQRGGEFVIYTQSSPLTGQELPYALARKRSTQLFQHQLRLRRR